MKHSVARHRQSLIVVNSHKVDSRPPKFVYMSILVLVRSMFVSFPRIVIAKKLAGLQDMHAFWSSMCQRSAGKSMQVGAISRLLADTLRTRSMYLSQKNEQKY